MTEPSDGAPSSAGGAQGNWLILALLVLICITLAGLWFMERSARTRAQTAVLEAQEQVRDRQRGLAALGMIPPRSEIDWSQQARRDITLDGRPRQAIFVSEGLGHFLGLATGDVVIVSPDVPPATLPADLQNRLQTP